MRFTVIGSEHISLYTNESALMMTEVSHIPQTAASHMRTASERRGSPAQNVDILREDRRDTFHQLPLIDEAHLRNVLPECSYNPTYIIKDFPLVRYQGLQFVRMSYIYPNDYTRLTHMETDNKCFYHANAQDLDSVGFSRYMRMDFPERLEDGRIPWDTQGAGFGLEDEEIQYEEDQGGDDNEEDQTEDVAQERSNNLPDYGDDYDDYAFNRKRKLFSMTAIERPAPAKRRKRQAKANIQEPPAQVPDTNQKEDQEVKVHRKKKSRRKSQIDSNGGSDVLPPNPLPAGKNASGFEMAKKGSHALPVQKLGLNTSQIEHHLVAGGPKANIVPLEKVNSVKNRTLHREVEQPAPPPITNLQAPPAGPLVLHVNRSRDIVPVKQIEVQENFVKQGRISKDRGRRFALLQVVNVEKRLDGSQGSRYLLELELLEQGRSRVRLSRYVYMAQRRSRPRILGRIKRPVEMVLCDPQGLAWNPSTTVHFIVPVKNQARWVKQFIVDMEDLYRKTKDKNFNIIITDYSSTDMDVEQELKNSAVPRYQYVKLSGNFERSAGLQAGIDLITDNHSIVFLCDLHIHFPPSIIDSIRKHCVEGKMAFAPIVMRLNCGATPQEPTGYWEVNGFGLLGIYKSDLDTAGGMNTKEFRDRWGGEDWELLDRILQAGLEVERIYLRNFMHHYHSKRGMWNRQTFKAT
ncbi:hypothetical protein AGOR_G00180420 [Albula goreensis]|uniref:Hexosyltransferase n=1 Tax=Albula goreensis TaxID=1534307 RepID=A0A8T3D000_9TELE|nr:hypothetical protein AGOR_G00180420 [Albula goreensis]